MKNLNSLKKFVLLLIVADKYNINYLLFTLLLLILIEEKDKQHKSKWLRGSSVWNYENILKNLVLERITPSIEYVIGVISLWYKIIMQE